MTADDVALARDDAGRKSACALEFAKMKTKIMKSLLNIAPFIFFAVALMQLYRENMELEYRYESLEWRMNTKFEQLNAVNTTLWRRTLAHRQDSSKAAR